MRWLDRAITALAPGWALRRTVARARLEMIDHNRTMLQASYDAAEKTRITHGLHARTQSADQAIVDDIPTMNARARLHARNNWIARSIVDGYRRHVVGKGITSWSDARDENGEPYTEFNRRADRLFWDSWAQRPEHCDIELRKTLIEIEGLMVEEFVEVGESIMIWSYQRQPDHVGLKLQLIEPEQLATDMYVAPGSGNEIRHGVEVGDHGQPLAYWIYTRGHPLEFRNIDSPERIPASRVLHFMRQNRVRQTHGVTRFAPILKKLWHLGMYDEYTLVRARLEACIGGVITNNPMDSDGNILNLGVKMDGEGDDPDTDEAGNEEFGFEPGMTPELPPGKDIRFHDPTTPGNNYEPFTVNQHHGIAAGSGLDFATVVKDYRQGSFISLRMGTLERDREIEPLQQLLIHTILRKIRDVFIEIAILEGRLEVPEGEDFFGDPDSRERMLKSNWRPPPKPPIDPAKQRAAQKIEIEQRLRSRASIIEETEGVPWREVFDAIDDEQEYARDLDIGLPDMPESRGGPTTTQTSASEPRPERDPLAERNGHVNGYYTEDHS